MRYRTKSIFQTTFDCRKVVCMFCLVVVAILATYQENFLIYLVLLFEYVLSKLKVKRSATVNVFGNIDLFCLKVLF